MEFFSSVDDRMGNEGVIPSVNPRRFDEEAAAAPVNILGGVGKYDIPHFGQCGLGDGFILRAYEPE
ncbi:MAG: hypothetical protein ACI36T_01065 [Eggerthellaceae bacterium]